MKHVKTIASAVLVAAISLGCTCVFATENAESTETTERTRRNSRFGSSVSEETKAERQEAFAAALAEKLEAGEITQEQYDKIVTVMESGAWNGMGGRANGKFAFAGNRAEMTATSLEEKLEAGEITQEQYDKIVAAQESRGFKGMGGRFNGKAMADNESTADDETDATEEETNGIGKMPFGNFKGKGGRMNGRANGRTWNQEAEESAE